MEVTFPEKSPICGTHGNKISIEKSPDLGLTEVTFPEKSPHGSELLSEKSPICRTHGSDFPIEKSPTSGTHRAQHFLLVLPSFQSLKAEFAVQSLCRQIFRVVSPVSGALGDYIYS